VGVGGIASKLARAGAKGRARGERARTQAQARAERRRDIAKEIAATRAAAVAAQGNRDVGPQPVATGFAHWIDALHRESGQILHFISLRGRIAQAECS
jgi:hypothetical protein